MDGQRWVNGSPAPDVLILGGSGRIGTAVALDILEHTGARVCLASRRPRLPPSLGALEPGRVRLARLDLTEAGALAALLSPPAGRLAPSVTSPVTPPVSPPVSLSGKAAYDLVIHCAGPFRQRDLGVLEACIAARVNYLDVSDSPDYVRSALALGEAAQRAGVTAIVSTGVFPGWSNSMARLAAEQFASLDRLQLNYVVAGSGGAGPTVMRTTFLELQRPFPAWIGGAWRQVWPYGDRELASFPPPLWPSLGLWIQHQ